MTSEIKPKPFNSIGANLAAGAGSLGLGYALWKGSQYMKVFGESGVGVSATAGAACMAAGSKILYDGVGKPLYGKALEAQQKVKNFMNLHSMRNGAIFLGAIPSTFGAAGTLLCLAAGAPVVALGAAAVGAGGAAYLYKNRKNLFDRAALSDSPLDVHEILPNSRLHFDYPQTVQIDKDDNLYSSFGAAYEARKFLPEYRYDNFQSFSGRPASEIRAMVLLAQASGEKNSILAPAWTEAGSGPADAVNKALQSFAKTKFGLGLKKSDRTLLQNKAREELLKTKETVLLHPDITNATGDKVLLKGTVIAQVLTVARDSVQKEDAEQERASEEKQANKSILKSSSSSRPSLFSSHRHHRRGPSLNDSDG